MSRLKALLTFGFHLSINNSTWDTSLDLFPRQFWVDDVIILSQNFKILRGWFHKWIINLKISFTFDFHLSINIGTWYTNLNFFHPFLGWWRHHEESKLQNFEMVVSTNTSNFPLLLPFIFLFSLVHGIQVWVLFDTIFG